MFKVASADSGLSWDYTYGGNSQGGRKSQGSQRAWTITSPSVERAAVCLIS